MKASACDSHWTWWFPDSIFKAAVVFIKSSTNQRFDLITFTIDVNLILSKL